MLNIGFDVNKHEDDAIFYTHDVDLNPSEETIISNYKLEIKEDEIISIYSDDNTLGGIITFKSKTFLKINGFPNNFWGWGIEDKALQNRAEFYRITIKRQNKYIECKKSNKFKIFDDVNDRIQNTNFNILTLFEYNEFEKLPIEEKDKHISSNGLNTLIYELLDNTIIDKNTIIIKVNF